MTHSDNIDDILKAIKAQINAQDYAAAYKALAQLAQNHADKAQIFLLKAQCEYAAQQYQRAEQSLKTALSIEPDDGQIHAYLGKTYLALGDFQRAEALLHKALSLKGLDDVKSAHLDLAHAQHKQNHSYGAIQTLKRLEAQYPQDSDIMHMRGKLAASLIPLWHIPMLAHRARNHAYETAIKSRIKAGDIVLDIGTGSGLLAMMAARAGAAHIYACESNPVLAKAARDIIALNGFTEVITIIEKHSSQIIIGQDMPQKADIAITEIFDNALLGEGALPSLRHAWAHLLKPDARIIPQAATLKGSILNSPHFDSYHHIDRICGFDLSPMAALSHPLSYKDINFDMSRSDTEICLSDAMEIYRWDFTQAPPPDFEAVVEFTAQKSGTGNAMMLWFDLDLTETIKFSTQDPHPQDHWRQVCQIIPYPKTLKAAQQYQLRASYRGYYNFIFSD